MSDARWEQIQSKRRTIHAHIAKLAEKPCMLAIPDPDKRTVHVISPDLEDTAKWRASRFDDQGPMGHSIGPSFEGALRAAWDYGADILRAVEVTPQTVDSMTSDWITPRAG